MQLDLCNNTISQRKDCKSIGELRELVWHFERVLKKIDKEREKQAQLDSEVCYTINAQLDLDSEHQ